MKLMREARNLFTGLHIMHNFRRPSCAVTTVQSKIPCHKTQDKAACLGSIYCSNTLAWVKINRHKSTALLLSDDIAVTATAAMHELHVHTKSWKFTDMISISLVHVTTVSICACASILKPSYAALSQVQLSHAWRYYSPARRNALHLHLRHRTHFHALIYMMVICTETSAPVLLDMRSALQVLPTNLPSKWQVSCLIRIAST